MPIGMVPPSAPTAPPAQPPGRPTVAIPYLQSMQVGEDLPRPPSLIRPMLYGAGIAIIAVICGGVIWRYGLLGFVVVALACAVISGITLLVLWRRPNNSSPDHSGQ